METPSQKAAKAAQAKKEPNPLQEQLDKLQVQVNANEAEKQAALKVATEAAEEKKQSESLQREQELQAESDLKTLINGVDGNIAEDATKKRNVEDLSNAQVIDVIVNSVDKAFKARDKLAEGVVKKEVASVKESVAGIKKVLTRMHVQSSVDAARSEHKDFDDYREEILAVMQQYEGIAPGDAYVIAKDRSAKKVPAKKSSTLKKKTAVKKKATAKKKAAVKTRATAKKKTTTKRKTTVRKKATASKKTPAKKKTTAKKKK